MTNYCNLSIFFGIILVIASVLSFPLPQLRIVVKDIRIIGGSGVVLIALGLILGALGFCPI